MQAHAWVFVNRKTILFNVSSHSEFVLFTLQCVTSSLVYFKARLAIRIGSMTATCTGRVISCVLCVLWIEAMLMMLFMMNKVVQRPDRVLQPSDAVVF